MGLTTDIDRTTLNKYVKRMRPTALYSMQSLVRYQALHEVAYKEKYPHSYKDGHYFFEVPNKKPSARLTEMICKALEWMGHEANRIDTKGTAVIDKKATPKYDIVSGKVSYGQKVKFIPTKTKTGTEDVAARLIHTKHPFGVPWAIEVKINDRQSPEQKQRETELKSKGLWYDVIRNLDIFFTLYDLKIKLLDG